MQKVDSKPCDVCGQRSTSYSSGHGRWCDKHSPLPNFNPDLKGRREALKRRIALIVVENRNELRDEDFKTAEKILQELKL